MSEFDALLQIGALALGIAAGYVAYSYLASAALQAAADLIAGTQAIRSARADGVVTDEELVQIGRKTLAFEASVGNLWILSRRR